jgi:membrane-bound lytic murein transglycosylase B
MRHAIPKHTVRALLLAAALGLGTTAGVAAPPHAAPPSFAKRAAVRAFIADMAHKHGFVPGELELLFSKARYQAAVIKAIKPGAPGVRSWQSYRSRFINPLRIQAGAEFWRLHAGALARAEREYGVPAEIIVAIVGVETVYGRNMGGFRVIDALSTLAFDYPPRSEFFLGELENFLLLARESGRDVFSIKGSYAGAIGIPQFMPGSYRRYAVDFDDSGQADLRGSPDDAIGSVANFLKSHGWEAGAMAAFTATVQGNASRNLAEAGLKPSARAADLGAMGVSLAVALPADTLCALIPLETPDQPDEYLVGLHNFWVITRYNRSSFYAASVLELAAALKADRPEPAK